MLPDVDPTGSMTGRQAAGYALALVPAGLLPTIVGLAGPLYFAGALVLGLFYLASAVRFWRTSPTRPPGGCCGRRSCTCRRSCCCCC